MTVQAITAVKSKGFTGVVATRVGAVDDCKFQYGTIECWSNFQIKYDEIEQGRRLCPPIFHLWDRIFPVL